MIAQKATDGYMPIVQRHLSGLNSSVTWLTYITRPMRQMSAGSKVGTTKPQEMDMHTIYWIFHVYRSQYLQDFSGQTFNTQRLAAMFKHGFDLLTDKDISHRCNLRLCIGHLYPESRRANNSRTMPQLWLRRCLPPRSKGANSFKEVESGLVYQAEFSVMASLLDPRYTNTTETLLSLPDHLSVFIKLARESTSTRRESNNPQRSARHSDMSESTNENDSIEVVVGALVLV